MPIRRIIVTGAVGTGTDLVAKEIAQRRPDLPVTSYDALRQTRNLISPPIEPTRKKLDRVIQSDQWVIEGSPNFLPLAVDQADAVIWLDLPEPMRAWNLAMRPLQNIGRTHPIEDYRQALRSLHKRDQIRAFISRSLARADDLLTWHCRSMAEVRRALDTVGRSVA